ncbi:MAG TPA: methyltransferase domain-containing protein [Alphaproteobacteria bacterium]|nr:methyltransferase domain-containing protein [Alphaproteobacteria bacterium]
MLQRLMRLGAASSTATREGRGPEYDVDAVITALYRAALEREPDAAGFAAKKRWLRKGGTLDRLVQEILDSGEFRAKVLAKLIPSSTLPDLRLISPENYRSETTAYGETMTVFVAETDADFDRMEGLIAQHRYYDVPGVWGTQIDRDKKITAAIARGLGARTCLELGCFTGPVLSLLATAGLAVTGLDASHLAFALAYPEIRDRMVFGDLLSAHLTGPYDLILAMDILEHLNPAKLGAYVDRIVGLLAEDGYLYLNSPMFGEDDVFGTPFPAYIAEWQSVGDESYWRHLDCDARGWPKHGHLVWASPTWWEELFRARGLVRDRVVERAIHRRLESFFAENPGRRSLFVLHREGNRRASGKVADRVVAVIDAIDEAV